MRPSPSAVQIATPSRAAVAGGPAPRARGATADAARPFDRAWRVLLGLAPLFALGYLSLPIGGPARTIAYPVFGIIATVAISFAVRRHRPARPGAWLAIATGLALLSIGDVTYSVIALQTPDVAYPSAADVPYLIGYVTIALGVRRLVRGRIAGGDRMPMLDGAILAAGAAGIFWLVVIRPSVAGQVDSLAATVSLTYPCLDLVLLGLVFRVLLSSQFRERSMQFLVAGLGLYFAADTIYAVAVLDGTYADGHPVDALWIVGVTLVAVAALHPSAARPAEAVAQRPELSRMRLALLAVAAMIAPAIIVSRSIQTGASDITGLVITWTILFGLVLIRLASTVDELGVSLLQRRRLQDDLRFEAEHDPLTRLANRALFERRLAEEIHRAPSATGLVFLDLDDFKAINDTLGHASGDEVLRIVAERIRRDLRPGDVAARLGGDEFAVLLTGCADVQVGAAVTERILGSLRSPVELNGRPFQVRASAGVATARPGATPIDLMRDADVAMYQAKSHGKDQAATYEAETHDQVVRSLELRTALAEAIATNQFFLEFQPAIDASTEQIVGAEALVRWRHPDRGVLPPSEFIGYAESSGLIHELGRWILHEACRAAAAWPARPDGIPLVVSVNLAAAQLLNPTLLDDVTGILADTGLPPARLFLEVTESALVDLAPARDALTALRALGIHLAMDDFGTGYSSLSYLTKLPFHVVKIDRAFIGSLDTDERVHALVTGVVGLCRGLSLQLCAEGVETEAQLAAVRRLGFEAAQGYLMARPLSAEALISVVAASSAMPLRDGELRPTVAPEPRPSSVPAVRRSAA